MVQADESVAVALAEALLVPAKLVVGMTNAIAEDKHNETIVMVLSSLDNINFPLVVIFISLLLFISTFLKESI
jgi:hypothetical protein